MFAAMAVFILAHTFPHHVPVVEQFSYFENRIIPLWASWGSYFNHFYFVLGRNKYDYKFLMENKCVLEGASRGHGRALMAHTPQTKLQNVTFVYSCYSSNPNIKKPVKFLYVANCTGEYFGYGPTCRSQEALRYYSYSPQFKDTNWFLFLDDDVYIRPYTLATILQTVPHEERVAMVGGLSTNGFSFYHNKKNTKCTYEHHDNVSSSNAVLFPFVQPAAISRGAVNALKATVDANGLTQLQRIWGGTHDAILAMTLWMHRVSFYSFGRAYRVHDLHLDDISSDLRLVDRVGDILRLKGYQFVPEAAFRSEGVADVSKDKSKTSYDLPEFSTKFNVVSEAGPLLAAVGMSALKSKYAQPTQKPIFATGTPVKRTVHLMSDKWAQDYSIRDAGMVFMVHHIRDQLAGKHGVLRRFVGHYDLQHVFGDMGALDLLHDPTQAGGDFGDQGLRHNVTVQEVDASLSKGDVEGYYYGTFFDVVPRKNDIIIPHELHIYLKTASYEPNSVMGNIAKAKLNFQQQVVPTKSIPVALTPRERMIRNQVYVANSIIAHDKSTAGAKDRIIRLIPASDIRNTYYKNEKGIEHEFIPFLPSDCTPV